ncbi:hypothetical protein QL285_093140 [Trifolium repens]|nr:hypothetical protein QL285_093140 [Trifolium repens]
MWHDYSSLKKEYTQSLDDSLNVGATAFDTTPVQLEFWKGIQISREVVDFVQVVKDWENEPYLVLTFFLCDVGPSWCRLSCVILFAIL